MINTKATFLANTPDYVFARMAANLDPQHAIYNKPYGPPNNNAICHYMVIKKAMQRGEPEDRIYLFGHGKTVVHSVLTTKRNQVLVDTFNGQFSPNELGVPNDEPLQRVAMSTVGDLYANFMQFDSLTEVHTAAVPKPTGDYSWFALRGRLSITRRGKEHLFRRGDKLGWRFSSNGKNFRLVSFLTGASIVYSIPITDESLKWLVRQDPKATKPKIH
jgi:hypothetical protein